MSRSFNALFAVAGSLPCAQCGTQIKQPAWSEPVNERRVLHLWNCRDCGYVFETRVFFCEAPAPALAA